MSNSGCLPIVFNLSKISYIPKNLLQLRYYTVSSSHSSSFILNPHKLFKCLKYCNNFRSDSVFLYSVLSHTDYFCLTTGQAAKWKQTVTPLTASRLAVKGEILSRLVMVSDIAFFVSFFLCMNVLLCRSLRNTYRQRDSR